MHRGYVKLWRKIVDSGIINHPELLQTFIWILVNAAHEPKKVMGVELQPGQLVLGRYVLSAALRIKPDAAYKRLKTLSNKKWSMCSLQSSDRYTVVSVCNWESYQGEVTDTFRAVGVVRSEQGNTIQELKALKNKTIPPISPVEGEKDGHNQESSRVSNNEINAPTSSQTNDGSVLRGGKDEQAAARLPSKPSGKKRRSNNGECLFRDSPEYDYSLFRSTLVESKPEITDEEARYWYEECNGYSEAKGGKYISWTQAALNWRRKRIAEGRPIPGYCAPNTLDLNTTDPEEPKADKDGFIW